jgi:2-iminoacetate synthase
VFPAFFLAANEVICPSGIAKPSGRPKLPRMSFASLLDNLPLQKSPVLHRFEDLISRKCDADFEALAQESRALTLQNFGRTMRLFALFIFPTNVSTTAVTVAFHGTIPFSASPQPRASDCGRTVFGEQRFRQILLVAGEHPKFVSQTYLADCVRARAGFFIYLNRGWPNGGG